MLLHKFLRLLGDTSAHKPVVGSGLLITKRATKILIRIPSLCRDKPHHVERGPQGNWLTWTGLSGRTESGHWIYKKR